MVERKIIETLHKFRKALEENQIKVAKILLYGSRKTGRFHKDSDIDVAVVSPDFGKDRFKEGTKIFEIAYKIDARIEPVAISLKSYEEDTWIPLIYEIRSKGLEILSLPEHKSS